MSDEKPLPEPVLAWLERVDARWRDSGVSVDVRTRMGADLAEDLREAVAAGAPPAAVTAERAEAFADRLAAAHGGLPAPPPLQVATAKRVVLTGLAGSALAGLVVWIFLIPFLGGLVVAGRHEVVSVLAVYAVCGAVVVAGCVGAIAYQFRGEPVTARIVRYVAPAMVLTGLLSVAPAVGFAWLLGYSTSAAGVVLVGGLVLGFVAAGIYLGQWLARRDPGTTLVRLP
jgi:hypothetical protein